MKKSKTRVIVLVIYALVVIGLMIYAASTGVESGTAWSLLAPVLAIVLALITKEVYSALFAGILCRILLLLLHS